MCMAMLVTSCYEFALPCCFAAFEQVKLERSLETVCKPFASLTKTPEKEQLLIVYNMNNVQISSMLQEWQWGGLHGTSIRTCLPRNGLARRYNKSTQMSFKDMGQTVKQCLGCSTDMEAWISYSLRFHPWGSVCRNRFHMTPNGHLMRIMLSNTIHFRHLQHKEIYAKLPCPVWVSRWLHVYPQLASAWLALGLQNLVVRSNSQRLGTLCHETWGLVRRKLLNSLLKWKALCGQNFHIK